MATVRNRREIMEGAPFTFKHPPPAKELDVYLITSTRTTSKINKETGAPVADTITEAHVEDDENTVTNMLAMKKTGDDRLKNTRAWRFKVAPNGRPTIGSERRA